MIQVFLGPPRRSHPQKLSSAQRRRRTLVSGFVVLTLVLAALCLLRLLQVASHGAHHAGRPSAKQD